MVIKLLAHSAAGRLVPRHSIYFVMAYVRDLSRNPRVIWAFDSKNQSITFQTGDLLICKDGVRRVSHTSGPNARFTHCQPATATELARIERYREAYTRWRAEHARWKPPHPVRILPSKTTFAGRPVLRTSATDRELRRKHIHFIQKDSLYSPPNESLILNDAGSLWGMTHGKLSLLEKDFLTFPPHA